MSPNFSLTHKRIWVAGETGMVGRAVLKKLENIECQILSAPHSKLNLTDAQATEEWLTKHQPDVIVMTAGKVGGIGANASEPEAFYNENLAMAQSVIHGAHKANVAKLLYLGSSCVYPKESPQPIVEEALEQGALEPTNAPYARAKIAGIKLCRHYRQKYGCDYITAMPTNLYGPHDHFDAEKSHVIPALILKIHQAKMENKKSVTLWGTGTPLREFLHVDDLAEALVLLLEKYSDNAPINIGSGFEISIQDLASKIKNVIGYDGGIIFDDTKPDGTMRKFLNSSKIHDLGWRTTQDFDEGLRKTYDWFLNDFPHRQ